MIGSEGRHVFVALLVKLSVVVANARTFMRQAESTNIFWTKTVNNKTVIVKVEQTKIRHLAAKIHQMDKEVSFSDIFSEKNNPATVEVEWQLSCVSPISSEDSLFPFFDAVLKTRKEKVLLLVAKQEEAILGQDDNAEAIAPASNVMGKDAATDDSKNTNKPDNKPNTADANDDHYSKHFAVKAGHAKQDNEHTFISFSRVLLKKHGAFGPLMA